MASPPRVYVASPLGFAASTRAYVTDVLSALQHRGIEALDPWNDPSGDIARAFAEAEAIDNAIERRDALATVDAAVGQRNQELLEQADGVLAILDGTDVDSGTAAEIGFAAARGTPIVGVRTDMRRTGENEGCIVNLQVEFFIRDSGGAVTRDLHEGAGLLASLLGIA